MKWFKLNSKGDTIVEVLLAIAVMSLVLSVSYSVANRSSQTTRAAQERGEAQKITEEQLEFLRGYVSPSQPWDNSNNKCFKPDGDVADYSTPADCQRGPSGDNRYDITITYNPANNSYTSHTVWFNVQGGTDQLDLAYKLPESEDIPSTEPPPGPHSDISADDTTLTLPGDSTIIHWNTDPDAVRCDVNNFDAPPGLPPYSGSFPTGPIALSKTYSIQCYNDLDTPGNKATITVEVVIPLPIPDPATASPSSHEFPAWHLFAETGSKQNKQFEIKNPDTSPATINLTTVDISGADEPSFKKISDNCSNASLEPGQSCRVRVEFFPPSGPGNNRYSNAGNKTATLTINNSDDVASAQASLSGWAVTDRLAPNESIPVSSDDGKNSQMGLRGYNSTCYNDAFSCPSLLVVWSNGNMVRYRNAAAGCPAPGDCAITGDTGANLAIMQPDANFVMYNAGGVPVWNTGAPYSGAGVWLMIFDGGAVWRMNPSWNGFSPGGFAQVF